MSMDNRSCYACDITSEGVCREHRLADAAPALLEALEKAARRLDDAADLMADSEDAHVTHKMADEARAAIAQAMGEQP